MSVRPTCDRLSRVLCTQQSWPKTWKCSGAQADTNKGRPCLLPHQTLCPCNGTDMNSQIGSSMCMAIYIYIYKYNHIYIYNILFILIPDFPEYSKLFYMNILFEHIWSIQTFPSPTFWIHILENLFEHIRQVMTGHDRSMEHSWGCSQSVLCARL